MLHLFGGTGFHIAVAEPAGAVKQLRAFPADGQPCPVNLLRGADGIIQQRHIFRDTGRQLRFARFLQQAAALLAGIHISHGW